ncbi:MAG TPA: endonuclease/exonuclease/phosphatase family protein [Gaiellaceae bacterium]
MVVRTWNVFHGNAKRSERRAFLKEMVQLVTSDSPDVVCLQEVPVWALAELGAWSGMQAFGAVAARPSIGPLPSTAAIGRALTIHHGLLRSAFTGQANAVLVSPHLRAVEQPSIVLNSRRFRRAQARWLGLGLVARLAWAKERRVCQAVRVVRDGGTLLVANLHATSFERDERLADAELLRAAAFVDGLAAPGEPILLCGDFNVEAARSRTLADLCGPEWGFAGPGPGIDHILVRGVKASAPRTWSDDRRTLDGRLLSDHAPLEVELYE